MHFMGLYEHLIHKEYPLGIDISKKMTISDGCKGCGICVKICPMKNIEIVDGKPEFGQNCSSCGGCMQNCPKACLHHADEKSDARYRNPHIKVDELFLASDKGDFIF